MRTLQRAKWEVLGIAFLFVAILVFYGQLGYLVSHDFFSIFRTYFLFDYLGSAEVRCRTVHSDLRDVALFQKGLRTLQVHIRLFQRGRC